MKPTKNGIMIPDEGNTSSSDTFGKIVNAVINHGNILDGMFPFSIIEQSANHIKLKNGTMIQWGMCKGVIMDSNRDQISSKTEFLYPFDNSCDYVFVSDAGGQGMAFGADYAKYTRTDFVWCTANGLGIAGLTYAPMYWAIGH